MDLSKIENYRSTPIDRVPTIPLYMDQVLSYLETTLEPLKREAKETCMTKTMINNYVKAGVLKAPKKKKYDRLQLMAMTMLYRLKNTLQIKDVEKLLGHLDEGQMTAYYERYLEAEERVNKRLRESIADLDLAKREDALKAILDLCIEADAKRRLAENLIDLLETGETRD
jgi:hypothetical protein